jgi:hypothetical protein
MSQEKNKTPKKSPSHNFFRGIIPTILAILLIVFMLGMGLKAATDSSRPGDIAFPIDRMFEKLRISTALSDNSRFKFKVSVAQERLDELLSFDETDTERILKSLDELEQSLLDIRAEIDNIDDLADSREASYEVMDNLLDLIRRYRAFLNGDTNETEDIQKEFDDSVEQINKIVSKVNQGSSTPVVQPVQNSNPSTGSPDPQPSTGTTCNTKYTQLGGEIEKEGVTLKKNSCDEYTVTYGGTTYVLLNGGNLDYALNQQIKFHGIPGTNNSIYVTEFELDN